MPVVAHSNWLFCGADKWLHTGLFFWLAVTALWLWRDSAIVWSLLAMAMLTELSQAVTPWRSAEILDLLADAIGIGLAWCIWCWQRQRLA